MCVSHSNTAVWNSEQVYQNSPNYCLVSHSFWLIISEPLAILHNLSQSVILFCLPVTFLVFFPPSLYIYHSCSFEAFSFWWNPLINEFPSLWLVVLLSGKAPIGPWGVELQPCHKVHPVLFLQECRPLHYRGNSHTHTHTHVHPHTHTHTAILTEMFCSCLATCWQWWMSCPPGVCFPSALTQTHLGSTKWVCGSAVTRASAPDHLMCVLVEGWHTTLVACLLWVAFAPVLPFWH